MSPQRAPFRCVRVMHRRAGGKTCRAPDVCARDVLGGAAQRCAHDVTAAQPRLAQSRATLPCTTCGRNGIRMLG
eukprot:4801057-Alexandrium_andersonii.AAC.1